MWQKAAGHHNDHIDGRTGVHHITLENTATGGVHHLQIPLGAEVCPECSRAHHRDDLGGVDPKEVVAAELEMLAANHDALVDYAARHGVPIKSTALEPTVPFGFRASQPSTKAQGHIFLHPPAKQG